MTSRTIVRCPVLFLRSTKRSKRNVLIILATMVNNVAASVTELSTDLCVSVACTTATTVTTIEGCYLCRLNDHQDQILLCEHCNGEYHTYCLQPPLKSIPEYDWYCDNCVQFDPRRKHLKSDTSENGLDDELDRLVNALPYSITKRYGEIVFAQGGTGYGWWPCQIYDPRLAIDPNVRQAAQKHLHTRFLVYFFNCNDIALDSSTKGGTVAVPTNGTNNHSNTSATGTATPFSILPPRLIKSWVVGLSEDLFFGRAAKNHGKQRYRSFCDAFQLACIEFDKSINNALIDHQHRYILNEYVYPKTCNNTDQSSRVVNTTRTSFIGPTPEKRFRHESFLLPSPRHVGANQKMQVGDKKKPKEIKKRQHNKIIEWMRLPCQSRKRYEPSNSPTPIHHSSLYATGENDDDEDDGIAHPALANFNLSNNSKGRSISLLPPADLFPVHSQTKTRGRPKKKHGQLQAAEPLYLDSPSKCTRGRPKKFDQHASNALPQFGKTSRGRRSNNR